MSKNAPDFSSSFALVGDQLTETEQRLRTRKPDPVEDLETTPDERPADQSYKESENRINAPTSLSGSETKPKENDQGTPPTSVNRQREQRRNLTLKVLESNEAEFNRLFHRLQLAGDPCRKQDLADEALKLLFAKYR